MDKIIQMIPAVGWQAVFRNEKMPLVGFASDGYEVVGMVANGVNIVPAQKMPGFVGYLGPNQDDNSLSTTTTATATTVVEKSDEVRKLLWDEIKRLQAGNRDKPLLLRSMYSVYHSLDRFGNITVAEFLAALYQPIEDNEFLSCRGIGEKSLLELQKHFTDYSNATSSNA